MSDSKRAVDAILGKTPHKNNYAAELQDVREARAMFDPFNPESAVRLFYAVEKLLEKL